MAHRGHRAITSGDYQITLCTFSAAALDAPLPRWLITFSDSGDTYRHIGLNSETALLPAVFLHDRLQMQFDERQRIRCEMVAHMDYTDYDGPDDEVVREAKGRLHRDLATPGLAKLVTAYFDPSGPFAGRTFDRMGCNPADKITCDDLLAVTLLGVRWTPPAVRQLLGEQASTATGYLTKISSDANLWDAADQELRAVDELWAILTGLPDVRDTIASKLLARKRPRLAPISDRVIVTVIGTRGQTWPTLRRCLQDELFRHSISELRRSPEAKDASILRLFDVALWMLYSGSKDARNARRDAGLLLICRPRPRLALGRLHIAPLSAVMDQPEGSSPHHANTYQIVGQSIQAALAGGDRRCCERDE